MKHSIMAAALYLLLLHEYTVSNNSGIWLEPGLLDLDMATQRCRIAPLHHIGDGLFRLRIFYEDWILIEGDHYTNGNRSDYARLWNWSTDEVLRIRPGVFGSESFKALHAGRFMEFSSYGKPSEKIRLLA